MTAITLTHGQLALFVTMIRKRGRKMLATLTVDPAGNVTYHVSRLGRWGPWDTSAAPPTQRYAPFCGDSPTSVVLCGHS